MSLRNPVKYPVKYYSWQDTQAPQLSNVDGAIKTILKACLVTGYGSKAGAGWTALFEDAYRIVLRRPLRTGNPPDIKIENGTISGSTKRHRIVAQNNPTGLDDANELLSANLLSKGVETGGQWHCLVTDFAFVFAYRAGEYGGSGSDESKCVLYIGDCQSIIDNKTIFLITNTSTVGSDGGSSNYRASFLSDNSKLFDVRTGLAMVKTAVRFSKDEKYANNDYFAQKILLNSDGVLNIYCPFGNSITETQTKTINLGGRNMLKLYEKLQYVSEAYYIPLDYWEL